MQVRGQNSGPHLIERVVAAGSYLTFGIIGFIWIIIGAISKSSLKPFLQYHIMQSLFIAFCFWIFTLLLGLVLNVVSFIPFINQIVMQIMLLFNMPLLFGFSLIQLAMYSLMIYLAFTSFQGQSSYVPWISDIIKANIRR